MSPCLRRGVAAALLLIVGGCGTIMGGGRMLTEPFQGVLTDVRFAGQGQQRYLGPVKMIFGVLDLPFSAIADVSLCPIALVFGLLDLDLTRTPPEWRKPWSEPRLTIAIDAEKTTLIVLTTWPDEPASNDAVIRHERECWGGQQRLRARRAVAHWLGEFREAVLASLRTGVEPRGSLVVATNSGTFVYRPRSDEPAVDERAAAARRGRIVQFAHALERASDDAVELPWTDPHADVDVGAVERVIYIVSLPDLDSVAPTMDALCAGVPAGAEPHLVPLPMTMGWSEAELEVLRAEGARRHVDVSFVDDTPCH